MLTYLNVVCVLSVFFSNSFCIQPAVPFSVIFLYTTNNKRREECRGTDRAGGGQGDERKMIFSAPQNSHPSTVLQSVLYKVYRINNVVKKTRPDKQVLF